MQYLYIIKCQEYYKIGVATDVGARLAQLSTGNPYPLEVETIYKFDNADPVERAVHQRYSEQRVRGEWFNLSYDDQVNIHKICLMLGGSAYEYDNQTSEEEIEEAEKIAEPAEGAKYDYAAMFADGWRMERQSGSSNGWNWRRGSRDKRETIYGGTLTSLPYSIENMRLVYRDKLEPEVVSELRATENEK